MAKTKSSMDRGSIKHLSSKQISRNFGLMDRKSCQGSIEMKPRNLDGLRSCCESIGQAKSKEKIFNGLRICQSFYREKERRAQ